MTAHMESVGVVTHMSHGVFKVKLDGTPDEIAPILCTIAGKIRINKINILVGDKVRVRLSPYDTTRGVITFRLGRG